MKIDYTERGFRIAAFKDRNGELCSIQESSSVTPSPVIRTSPRGNLQKFSITSGNFKL